MNRGVPFEEMNGRDKGQRTPQHEAQGSFLRQVHSFMYNDTPQRPLSRGYLGYHTYICRQSRHACIAQTGNIKLCLKRSQPIQFVVP